MAGGTSTELGVGRILAGVIQFSKKLSDVNPSESASRTSDDQGLWLAVKTLAKLQIQFPHGFRIYIQPAARAVGQDTIEFSSF